MKKHSPVRKIIVATAFFVVLVIVAPLTVLYSMGYRFNKEDKIIVQSGSIVLKTTPFNVDIAVSGSTIPQKKIDLINRSYNINGLMPGSYEVAVSAGGYRAWKKQAEVHSGIATEFWNVVLVPENLARKTLAEGSILKYSISPDKNNIAYFEQRSDYLSLFVQAGVQNILVYQEPANQKFIPAAGELKWSSDSRYLMFSLKKGDSEDIYFVDKESEYGEVIPIGEIFSMTVTKNQANDNSPIQPKKTGKPETGRLTAYSWDEQNNIYFVSGEAIYLVPADKLLGWWKNLVFNNVNSNVNSDSVPDIAEVRKRIAKDPDKLVLAGDNLPLEITKNARGFTFCGRYLCLVNDEKKALTVISQSGEIQAEVPLPGSYEETKAYQLFAYSEELAAVLDEKGNLFLWDDEENKKEGGKGMKFIFSGVREVYFSDDGKKLLFATKNEAYVYSVKEWEVQPKHLVGDLDLIWAQPEEFKNIQWYLDYQNILVFNENRVVMVELDDRGGRNTAELLAGQEINNAGYDTRERKLWFTEKGENGLIKLQEIAFPQTEGLFSGLMNGNNN